MKNAFVLLLAMGMVLAAGVAGAETTKKLPFTLDVNAGFDYDSNVNLRSTEYDVRKFQRKGNDGVYKHQAVVGYTHSFTPQASVNAQYSYYHDFHFRLTKFDAMSHNVSLTPMINLFRNYAQFRVWANFNYMTIGGDDYKVAWTFMPIYYHNLARRIMLEVSGYFERSHFFAPIVIEEDDRSAVAYGFGVGLYFYFNDARTGYLQLAYSPIWYEAEGRNFDCAAHKFTILAQIPFTRSLTVKPFVNYIYYPYFHNWVNASAPTLNIYPRREDSFVSSGVTVTYKLPRNFYVEGAYNFTFSGSNINFYRYERHVLGARIGYRF